MEFLWMGRAQNYPREYGFKPTTTTTHSASASATTASPVHSPSSSATAGLAKTASSSESKSRSSSDPKTSVKSGSKRPRIPGHSRPLSSTSSRSQDDSVSHEIPHSLQDKQLPATVTAAASASTPATAGRTPASSSATAYHQNKQLPPLPRKAVPINSTFPPADNNNSNPGFALGGTSNLSTAAFFRHRNSGPVLPSSTSHFASAKPTSTSISTSTFYSSQSQSQSTPNSPLAGIAPDRKHLRGHHHAVMSGPDTAAGALNSKVSFSRAETATTNPGSRAMNTSDAASSTGDGSSAVSQPQAPKKPFVVKSNGRTYLADPSSPYPLPVDLQELHRQSLRTLLLFQCFGGPVCSPVVTNKPPTKVLELGCGFGFWSMMCHRYYSRQGHSNISFTGLDIVAVGGISQSVNSKQSEKDKDKSSDPSSEHQDQDHLPDKNMRWDFVQHDICKLPWPFEDNTFDLVMAKDLSLASPNSGWQILLDEYMRVLKPGGTIEIWECDHTIRMLRPHTPESSKTPQDSNDSDDRKSDESQAAELGAYIITANTPLSSPMNTFLVEYNSWIIKYTDIHRLNAVPCAMVGPILVQEPLAVNSGSKRLAIPLSEVRWEREGVGGVITKDGKSYISSKGPKDGEKKGKALTPGQKAMRKTALLTVVQFIQGLEPVLREVSGKQQDEWDAWLGRMMADLMNNAGTSSGECLEVGAWWAQKKKEP